MAMLSTGVKESGAEEAKEGYWIEACDGEPYRTFCVLETALT